MSFNHPNVLEDIVLFILSLTIVPILSAILLNSWSEVSLALIVMLLLITEKYLFDQYASHFLEQSHLSCFTKISFEILLKWRFLFQNSDISAFYPLIGPRHFESPTPPATISILNRFCDIKMLPRGFKIRVKGFCKQKETLGSLLHFPNASPEMPKLNLDASKLNVENRKLRKDLCSLSDNGRLSVFKANSINRKENREVNMSKASLGPKRNSKTQEFGVGSKGAIRNLLKGKIRTVQNGLGFGGRDLKNQKGSKMKWNLLRKEISRKEASVSEETSRPKNGVKEKEVEKTAEERHIERVEARRQKRLAYKQIQKGFFVSLFDMYHVFKQLGYIATLKDIEIFLTIAGEFSMGVGSEVGL